MKSRITRQERERRKALVAAARHKSALLRIHMVKVALERNQFFESDVPALAKQLLFYSATNWFGQEHERRAIETAIAMAEKCIAAALANVDVQRAIQRRWISVAEIRAHTPIALEFEHAVSVADLGTCVSCSGTKNSFGQCLGISPLDADTPCHHERILYLYRCSSPYNRRVEQRAYLKRKLKKRRMLVTLAMRKNKGDFVREHESAAEIVQYLFRVPLGQFWRIVRGKEFIDVPKQAMQLMLPFE